MPYLNYVFFVNPAQSDGSRLLVVLLLKVHRVLRHGESERAETKPRLPRITLFFFARPQVFFVLRKKTSQVSTLHVIHHGVMPMSGEIGTVEYSIGS